MIFTAAAGPAVTLPQRCNGIAVIGACFCRNEFIRDREFCQIPLLRFASTVRISSGRG